MTESSNDQFPQWKDDVQSTNMVVVLNSMEEIVRDGDWRALGLLTIAGDNVTGIAKQMSITTPSGKLKFDEFRQNCIHRLQERLGARKPDREPGDEQLRVFISYNHQDRESAKSLALELTRANVNVFLDHWEMGAHEEILPRIERELHASDVVVALLSPRSSTSAWVRRELEIVIRKQEAEGGLLLLPVLLEDCEIPEAVAARPYHDLRDAGNRPMVAQAILNQIFGIKPFSQRALDFLGRPAPSSPYTEQAQLNGRRLLEELAKHEEMEIASNQKWFLWEAFHQLMDRYTCTLKIGRPRSSDDSTDQYSFVIVDRWNGTANSITLTPEEFDQGLWQGEVDLIDRMTIRSDVLEFVGSLGRFSLNSAFSPNVEVNTAEASSRERMEPVLRLFLKSCELFDEGSRQSFLFDYQRLVIPSDWHRVKVVVGSTAGGSTLAYSPMLGSNERDDMCGVFEVYDPFFSSLKYTQAYTKQLNHLWEGDVDLMSPATETLLGLG